MSSQDRPADPVVFKIPTHYDLLQVREEASQEVILTAWQERSQQWHPDRFPGNRRVAEQHYAQLSEAFRILSSPSLRAAYDACLVLERRGFRSVNAPMPSPSAATQPPAMPDTAHSSAATSVAPVPTTSEHAARSAPVPVRPTPTFDPWTAAAAPGGRFPGEESESAGSPRTAGVRGASLFLVTVSWIVFFALVWWSFDTYLQYRENPHQEVVITHAGVQEFSLRRNRMGHYLVPGSINGRSVTFLVDTGATQVSIPAHLGEVLGLQPGARTQAMTANGTVEVRQTRIPAMFVGPFRMENVSAHLNPGMSGEQILLGMSALRHLDFAQRGDRLILSVP